MQSRLQFQFPSSFLNPVTVGGDMWNPKKGNDKDWGENPAHVSEIGTGGRKASLDAFQNSVTDLQRKLDSRNKSSQKQYNADTKKKVTHIKK